MAVYVWSRREEIEPKTLSDCLIPFLYLEDFESDIEEAWQLFDEYEKLDKKPTPEEINKAREQLEMLIEHAGFLRASIGDIGDKLLEETAAEPVC